MDIINIIFIAVLICIALPMIVLIGINFYYNINVDYLNGTIQISNYNEEEKV
jgi:hypothetical protein